MQKKIQKELNNLLKLQLFQLAAGVEKKLNETGEINSQGSYVKVRLFSYFKILTKVYLVWGCYSTNAFKIEKIPHSQ